jgi:hypothetical protein
MRHLFRRQVLKSAKQHVILGDFDLFPLDTNLYQAVEWTEQRAGATHGGSGLIVFIFAADQRGKNGSGVQILTSID